VTAPVDEVLLRSLTPSVLGILVRRGADFAAAEDAVQDALVEAVRVWPADRPLDPKGWLVTVAWRRFLDAPGPTRPAAGARTWPTRSRRPDPRPRWTTRSSSTSCAPTRR
jgi:Predicted RNA polymerase sigma factor containing a TPR repeat domain